MNRLCLLPLPTFVMEVDQIIVLGTTITFDWATCMVKSVHTSGMVKAYRFLKGNRQQVNVSGQVPLLAFF